MWPGQSPPTGLAKECRDSDPAVPSGSAPAPSREGWRRLLRRSGDTRLAGGHSPGPEGKAPGLHRALASVPSAPHTHSSDPQAQIPGPSPSRYPRAHGTSCLCPERRLGTCSHPGGRAGSRLGRPGQRRVRVPGHGESRSCAGSSSGRSSGLMSRSSGISGRPETEVVAAAVKPGSQAPRPALAEETPGGWAGRTRCSDRACGPTCSR